ncbi:hypothetical protein [Vibrio europaeus]|uniref:hypothetical protein n=1 Tax=Vibrio europaeus TaxID=300876 RepID=UPI00148D6F67|nr:hypothetical protein [Vibrio europaeus]NOH23855.1 hypothetical protein [Vibrio europaeus]
MKKLTTLLAAAVIAASASSSATAFEGFAIQSPVYTAPSPVIIDPITPPIYDNPFSVENMPGSNTVCIGVSFACIGISWDVAPEHVALGEAPTVPETLTEPYEPQWPVTTPTYELALKDEFVPNTTAVCIGISFACIGISWNVSPTYDEYTNPYFTKSSQEPSFYDKFLGEPKQLDTTYDLCFGVCDYAPMDGGANYPTWPIQPMPSFTHLG